MSDAVTAPISPYRAAVARGDDELRTALLDQASELLSSEGPQALSLRRIATAVGCSTTVLYTVFGGKSGIAEALFREGFARFAARLASVAEDLAPLERLIALSRAYRANALVERNYYGVMFGQSLPGFTPSDDALLQAAGTLDVLARQVRICMDAGIFAGDPREITEVLWAAAHGAVSLELAGFFPDEAIAKARFDALTTAAGTAYLAHPTTQEAAPS